MKLLQEIKIPQESVNDDALLIVAVPFENGAEVKDRDIVLELESSKTTFTVECEVDGYIEYLYQEGDEVGVNQAVIRIYDSPLQNTGETKTEPNIVPVNGNGNGHHKVQNLPVVVEQSFSETFFSQEAEKLMKEQGVATEVFSGRDFISADDVWQYLGVEKNPVQTQAQAQTQVQVQAQVQNRPAPSLPKVDADSVDLEPISSIKKKEIQYLSSVQSAGLNSQVEILVDSRGILPYVRPYFEVIKDSFLPLIIFESSRLLKQYPAFNAYFSQEGIAYYREINVGIAMDMGKGLKVLKLPQTDQQSFQELERQILALSDNYINDQIRPEQLGNITFTITDLSAEGISAFSPLINMKNSAILGISAVDQQLERFTLTLTFDHRISVGKEAAGFLSELKSRLESYRAPVFQSGKVQYDPQAVHCHKCMKKLNQERGSIGFLKTVGQTGEEVFTCQSCLLGH